MANNISYIKIAPNIHLFLNKIERAKVEYNLSFTSGGAYFEKDGEKGVTHLLEHCAVARTKDMDFFEFRDFLFENDIYVNASTSRLYMNFVVSGHKLDKDKMLDLILEFAMNPTLTDKILNQEKEIVLREIERKYGDPNFRLGQFVRNHIFEKDSFYLVETLGDPNEVRNANIETIQHIRKRMIQNSHIIFKAVGDIDIEDIKAKLSKHIKENDKALPVDFVPENKLKKFEFLPLVSELAHSHAALDVTIPFPVNVNTLHTRMFFYELMFSHEAGILYNRLRNELGLIYSLDVDFDFTIQKLTLSVTCEINSVKIIVDEIKKAFSDFSTVFTNNRVNVIRNLAIKKQEMIEDNPNAPIDFMSNTLWDYGLIMHPDEYISKIRETGIEDIKDIYEEVQNSLNKVQVLVVSNNKEVDKIKL